MTEKGSDMNKIVDTLIVAAMLMTSVPSLNGAPVITSFPAQAQHMPADDPSDDTSNPLGNPAVLDHHEAVEQDP